MKLFCTVTDTYNIVSVQINNSHTSQSATAQIEALQTTLDIGSYVSINLGYVGAHSKVFTGYVKNIELKEPSRTYSITCADVLVRAMDFFIAASDPENPYKAKGIKAEELVRQIIAMAGLNDYVGDDTLFTFGINNEFEVNLTTSYDYSRFIADILAYNIYADLDGVVHFTRRLPYVVNTDVSVGEITILNATQMSYGKTDRDLRNRVVVYGAEDIHAEASAVSPYLPSGFYKTVVVAAPTVFDNEGMAQQAADYNLALLNRLTESSNVVITGNPDIFPRTVITLTNPRLGLSGDWYVFSVTHSFGSGGFTTSLTLRK